jgi:Zn-dependent protease with chaperone function
MRSSVLKVLHLAMLALFLNPVYSQQAPAYFSSLSSDHYRSQIEQFKLRGVKMLYADKKEQKTYAGFVKDANKYVIDALENDEIVFDTLLVNRCEVVKKRLQLANPGFPFDSVRIYINRSSIPNAYAIGESGTVFVNLGLLLWLDNDEELSVVLGHEFAHYFLHHFDKALAKSITLLSSDDFKDEIKSIKKSRDGKYERFKALLKEVEVNNGKHSRFKESEADSLSAVFLKKAGYDINKAALGILQLDHVDDIFTADSLYFVKPVFDKSVRDDIVFRDRKRYNGLSSVAVTMNADADIDSVKTHPDCVVRYRALVPGQGKLPLISCCKILTVGFQAVKERALIEIVRNLYETGNLTLCVHFCLFARQNGYTQPLFNYYIASSFSDMLMADKKLTRFTYTNANANSGSTLKKLQDFIFELNQENLKSVAAWFLNHGTDISGDDYYFAQLRFDQAEGTEDYQKLKAAFLSKFPTSKYNYLFKAKPTK